MTSSASLLMAINPESSAAPRSVAAADAGAGRQQALEDLLLLEELGANAVEIAIPAENIVVVEPRAEDIAEDHAGVVQQSIHLAEDRGGLLGPADSYIRRQEAYQPAVLNVPILEHGARPAAVEGQGLHLRAGDRPDVHAVEVVRPRILDPGQRHVRRLPGSSISTCRRLRSAADRPSASTETIRPSTCRTTSPTLRKRDSGASLSLRGDRNEVLLDRIPAYCRDI